MTRRAHKRTGSSTPRKLDELVREVYPSREPEDIAAIRAFGLWRNSVPERVFRRARPVRLAGGVLYVNTATTAWASELDHMKETFLKIMQARGARVRELRFRVGPLPEMPKLARPLPPRPQPVALATLPEDLARALSRIDDDALRDVISQAASIALGSAPRR